MILFTSEKTKAALSLPKEVTFCPTAPEFTIPGGLLARIRAGEAFFFLGTQGIDALKPLWVDGIPGRLTRYSEVLPTAAGLPCELSFGETEGMFLQVRPQSRYAMHGIDEEPRAEVIPLLASRGKHGDLLGYPGMLLKNYDSSLTGGNYKGSFWYIFALEEPLSALNGTDWGRMIAAALEYSSKKCWISSFRGEFPLYGQGERIRLECRVENLREELSPFTVRFERLDEAGNSLEVIGNSEGVVNPKDATPVHWDWYPEGISGVVRLRATLILHDRYRYGLGREEIADTPDYVDSALLLRREDQHYPTVSMEKTAIAIDGATDFFIGTHLYPSSDFFELSYRGMRIPELIRTVDAIRRAGNKICRVWCDPILDEESLRGMEAMLTVLANAGIAAVFVIYNSWTHYMEINLPGVRKKFEVASMKDDCLLGLWLQNMEEQKEFCTILARKFGHMSHIIWDLTNEFSVVDPLPYQTGEDWLDPSFRSLQPPYQSIDLFRQWAKALRTAIQEAGVTQPVVDGISCWNTGSENYRCTSGGNLIADHSYHEAEQSGLAANYQNAACLGKPFYMEEFGGTWDKDTVRADELYLRYHYYMAAGDSAAVNYEWGVSWLCDRLSGRPTYLQFALDTPMEESEYFLYAGRYNYAKSWPKGCLALCPWTASFDYGSGLNCVDSPSYSAFLMKRAAQLGKGLGYAPKASALYLILPFETDPFTPTAGYPRRMERINNTLRALWSKGIPYQIWQEDQLDSLPESAQTLLYPNELEIRPEIAAFLESRRRMGATVLTGEDAVTGLTGGLNLPEGCRVFYRETTAGLLTLFSSEGPAELTFGDLRICHQGGFGCFLKDGDTLLRAEFRGSLFSGNTLICQSDAPVILLLGEDSLTVLPFEEGKITLGKQYASCQLLEEGTPLAQWPVEGMTLSITADEVPFALRLR
ncbi:MAG: hypothetical protein IJY82_06805 [Oscillospiraceae bacterium]|nr:hypothetical protein [Oscillospiraceae bacterium]